jgi:hypothetical protein
MNVAGTDADQKSDAKSNARQDSFMITMEQEKLHFRNFLIDYLKKTTKTFQTLKYWIMIATASS